jgi:hypothetical protein
MCTLWNSPRMDDFLRAREDISDWMLVKCSRSGNLPWITRCPQENDPITIRIEWSFNVILNPASNIATPQWMMSYYPRGFLSWNPVLPTANSLNMRQMPSVYTAYTAYTALPTATYPSVFGSALGPKINFCLNALFIGVQPAGQPFVNGRPFMSDCREFENI